MGLKLFLLRQNKTIKKEMTFFFLVRKYTIDVEWNADEERWANGRMGE